MQSLSREQLLALLGAARKRSERDWLMILVGFWHGLRASEVTSLTPEQVRDGFITVQRLKGSKRTTQPLLEHSNPLLNEAVALPEFIAKSRSHEPVFAISRGQFWRIVQRHAATAGIPSHLRHPHVLKHTIAMLYIDLIGIQNMRQWIGHKSLNSTGEYLQVSDEAAARGIIGALKS